MLTSTSYAPVPSGLYLPTKIAEKQVRIGRRPKAMDFFAGCGGMSLGIIQAGYEVVAAAEYDCFAAMTYATNMCRYGQFTMHFVTPEDEVRMNASLAKSYRAHGIDIRDGVVQPGAGLSKPGIPLAGSGMISNDASMPGVSHLYVGDVRKLTSERILKDLGMRPGDLDLVCGGPPCQGFSKAGKQRVADPRNNLVYEFGRFIVELNPRSFVMEEVPEVATMMDPDGVLVLDKFLHIVETGGFQGYDAFKKMAHGDPNRVGVMRGATAKKLEAEAKRERKEAARVAKAKVQAVKPPPGPARQMDMFA